MRLRSGKVPNYILVFVAIISVIFAYIAFNYRIKHYSLYYKEKLTSAQLTKRLFERIKDERLKRGIAIDAVNDPNQTGLIGVEGSPITSEHGDLNAKLTTTNPNISVVVVHLLKRCELHEGDLVAVSLSGSFPALNIAVLSAIQSLNLKPIIISSVGSSMWGANLAEFTYLDMENILYQEGLLKFRTVFASIGGSDDIGRGLSPEGRNLIIKAIQRNNIKEIKSKGLDEAIEKKFLLYHELAGGDKIKCFINVGGGATALAGFNMPTGIIDAHRYSYHQGLIGKFLREGAKAVNLDNINYLARRYDLSIAPIPIPGIGEGKLYYEERYSVVNATILLLILGVIVFFVLRIDIDYYIRRRNKDG